MVLTHFGRTQLTLFYCFYIFIVRLPGGMHCDVPLVNAPRNTGSVRQNLQNLYRYLPRSTTNAADCYSCIEILPCHPVIHIPNKQTFRDRMEPKNAPGLWQDGKWKSTESTQPNKESDCTYSAALVYCISHCITFLRRNYVFKISLCSFLLSFFLLILYERVRYLHQVKYTGIW